MINLVIIITDYGKYFKLALLNKPFKIIIGYIMKILLCKILIDLKLVRGTANNSKIRVDLSIQISKVTQVLIVRVPATR